MRHYEIMLLIHPDRSDQVSSMVQKYTEMVKGSNGIVHRLEEMKRHFRYPIEKLNKAYYVLMNIECDPKVQQEMQDSVAFNDSILRCLSIRQKKAITEPSVLSNESTNQAVESEGEKGEGQEAAASDKKATPKKRKQRAPVVLTDEAIDYKNSEFLAHYLTDTKKMARRRVTGGTAKQQHKLSEAIKRARFVGLLPYCDKYEQPEIN